ncbi:dsRNA-binding domain-like protein [Atractiella rhizophila]|nr:dsRNA-binding domain-like protein [Atractiella rhizophila]
MTEDYLKSLHQYVLEGKPVKNMTGKGKQMSMYFVTVVGDGNGRVGYGEGKDEEPGRAREKAFKSAVKNMDWVERCEGRTVWGEREEKLGSTRVILRERPPGFGLRCNRTLHEIMVAAGIKDVSAKVWGNRNRMKMVKCTVSMLWAAQIPQGMPRPLVESNNRLLKIEGMRSAGDVAKIRGRKAIDVTRTWEVGKGKRERRVDTASL